MNKKEPAIKSSKQAVAEADKLESVWSRESYLSLRVLIYCAELLERILDSREREEKFVRDRVKRAMPLPATDPKPLAPVPTGDAG